MHIMDLGIIQHIAASILFLLVWDTGIDGTTDFKVGRIWEVLIEAYDTLATPSGERLPHAVFFAIFEKRRSKNPPSYPELHSKAAIGRHCTHALNQVVKRMEDWSPLGASFTDDDDGSTFNMVKELLANCARFYDCILFHDYWLPEDAAQEAHDALLCVGCFHQALSNKFMTRSRKIFYFTEKAHYAQHIALDCLYLRSNPRFGWTYRDEDYMGKVKQLAEASSRARGPLKLGRAFTFRWRNRMRLLWKRRRR